MGSPYRSLPERAPKRRGRRARGGELFPLLALLWSASIVRLALAAHSGEASGKELMLARIVVLALPLIGRGEFRDFLARRRSATPSR